MTIVELVLLFNREDCQVTFSPFRVEKDAPVSGLSIRISRRLRAWSSKWADRVKHKPEQWEFMEGAIATEYLARSRGGFDPLVAEELHRMYCKMFGKTAQDVAELKRILEDQT